MAIELEVWLDVNCPYCYLGKKSIEQAITELAMEDEVSLIWRYFELDPSLPSVPVETKFEQLARKYDQKLAWAQLLCDSLTAQGIEYGIQFDFDNLKVCRSLMAHKALKYAEQQGVGNAYLARLFSQQFEHGQLLSDWTILSELANNLGISLPTESELEHDTRIQQAIDDDRDIAEQIGIQAVPFYVFNQAIGMEGVQPVAHFKQQLLALKNPQ